MGLSYAFTALPNSLLDSNLSPQAIALYARLGRHTTPDRQACWPSKARLCSQLKWSENTLEKYMRELTTAGWISREPRRDEHGRFRGWLYHVYSSPNLPSDQAGGSAQPITSRPPKTTGPQNLSTEVTDKKQQQEEVQNTQIKHEAYQSSTNKPVCVCKPPIQLGNLIKTELFRKRGGFTPAEWETIELTIERHQVQGTLQNLPGLMRYFATHGVDVSPLPQLREWKHSQVQRQVELLDSRRAEQLQQYQQHLLSCPACRAGETCDEGVGLRPDDFEGVGCFGCEHCELEEALTQARMIHCRRLRANVQNPLLHQCSERGGESR